LDFAAKVKEILENTICQTLILPFMKVEELYILMKKVFLSVILRKKA
jgi:hypothetical protein